MKIPALILVTQSREFACNVALYSVFGNEISFFAKKKSLSRRIVIFQQSNVRNLRSSTVYNNRK